MNYASTPNKLPFILAILREQQIREQLNKLTVSK
jgi:hypothetical protein